MKATPTILAGVTAFSLTATARADVIGDAYRLCESFENTGVATECDVSVTSRSVDVWIDTTGTEARKMCAGTVQMLAQHTRSFQGRWRLRIFSPFSGDHPIATCRLR